MPLKCKARRADYHKGYYLANKEGLVEYQRQYDTINRKRKTDYARERARYRRELMVYLRILLD